MCTACNVKTESEAKSLSIKSTEHGNNFDLSNTIPPTNVYDFKDGSYAHFDSGEKTFIGKNKECLWGKK